MASTCGVFCGTHVCDYFGRTLEYGDLGSRQAKATCLAPSLFVTGLGSMYNVIFAALMCEVTFLETLRKVIFWSTHVY